MSDPTPNLALPLRDDDPTREAKIEALLITGLDEYFRGEYELAISRWTRVLFLDRAHARARAYIERARCALAERQRESDELLHSGLDAFERGDIAAARALLSTSVQRGGPHEAAVALLGRIDRLEPVAPGPQPTPAPAVRTRVRLPAPTSTEPVPERHPFRLPLAIGLALAAAALAVALFTDGLERASLLPRAQPGTSQAAPPALRVPSRTVLAVEHARKLYDRGHLHEALAALETVDQTDPLRPEADAVKTAIQRMLLSSAVSGIAPTAPARPGIGAAAR